MKSLLTGLFAFALSAQVFATDEVLEEVRVYNQTSSTSAEVLITNTETQAAFYVDGQENAQFIASLLENSETEVAKLAKTIKDEMCGDMSEDDFDGLSMDYICGYVDLTEGVVTSYGRGGWMSAGAEYTVFLGFRSAGTGRFFDASHMIVISEYVEALTNEEGEPTGEMLKQLSFERIVELPRKEK